MNKPLGPGISYSTLTKQYTATLGVKKLGQYKTLQLAAKNYNEAAQKIFSFPILNKNYIEIVEEVLTPIEQTIEKEDSLDNTKEVNEIIEIEQQDDIPILDKVMDILKGNINGKN